MTLEKLEARIARLEDSETLNKVWHRYLNLIDTQDWQGATNMFTESAVLELGTAGCYRGKEEIAGWYRGLPQSLPLIVHMSHNPVIEVEGDNATGEWYYETPATDAEANRAMWFVGKHKAEFTKVNGQWKIKTLIAKCIYNTPYDEGWVKTNLCE